MRARWVFPWDGADRRPGTSAVGSLPCRGAQVLFFKDQRTLEEHLDLGAGGDVDISAAGKQADEARGGDASGQPDKAAGQRMTAAEPGKRANRASGGDADLGHFAHVAGLVAVLLDGSLAVLHLLLAGAGQAVHQAGNLHHGSIGKDHGGEVHVKLGAALDVAGTLNAIDHALHVNADGNERRDCRLTTGKMECR